MTQLAQPATRPLGPPYRLPRLWVAVLAGLAALGSAGPAAALTEPAYQTIAKQTLEGHIRPRYGALAASAGALAGTLDALCKSPSAKALSAARADLKKAIIAWAGVEHIRFGPVAEANRFERLAHWPDRKGIGLRQVRRILRKQDPSVLDPKRLAEKSVAVQGLTAVEFLLFGTGHDALAAPGETGAFRCGYALSAARNVQGITKAIERGWAGDGAFAKAYLNPKADAKGFRSHKEVVFDIYKAIAGGLQQVSKLKIGRPLGPNADTPSPKRAAFWRSQSSLAVISTNIAAAQDLFERSGFAGLVEQAEPGATLTYLYEFKLAQNQLANLKPSIARALSSKAGWGVLNHVDIVVKSLQTNAAGTVARAADLPLGFNAFDGD